jgi:hypothetical protein
MNIKVPSKDPRTFVPSALQDSGLANLTLYNYLWNEIKVVGAREGKGKERKVTMQSPICGIRSNQHLDKPNLQQHNKVAFINS